MYFGQNVNRALVLLQYTISITPSKFKQNPNGGPPLDFKRCDYMAITAIIMMQIANREKMVKPIIGRSVHDECDGDDDYGRWHSSTWWWTYFGFETIVVPVDLWIGSLGVMEFGHRVWRSWVEGYTYAMPALHLGHWAKLGMNGNRFGVEYKTLNWWNCSILQMSLISLVFIYRHWIILISYVFMKQQQGFCKKMSSCFKNVKGHNGVK